jgi:16S rRNA (uracil1498-N3)-methyltransferase
MNMPDTIAACAAEPGIAAHAFTAQLADTVLIEGADGRHLAQVRRLRAGEHMTLADGGGAWRRYAIAHVAKAQLQLEAVDPPRIEPQSPTPYCAAVALQPRAQLDRVVTELSEVGADRLIPVRCARCVSRWDATRGDDAPVRMERIARQAAMQCRRARPLEIAPPIALCALAGTIGLVVALAAGTPATGIGAPPAQGWTVLTGPEGGFEPAELETLASAGTFARIRVSRYVLRAETAPAAVAAVLLALSDA